MLPLMTKNNHEQTSRVNVQSQARHLNYQLNL